MITIGVSSCFMYPDSERSVFGPKTLCYLENDMARYLSRSDVLPVLIPDLYGSDMAGLLEKMDGFVFQGGADLSPNSYGEKPIKEGKWNGDKYRDEYELLLMDYAIKKGKPVLGICRGMQLMNVYFGGTLYQDINTQKPSAIKHRDSEMYDQLYHAIQYTNGSLFESIHADKNTKFVNSVHHQGIKDLGKDLKTEAVCAEDGLIEALIWKGAEAGKVMAIQWHPEFFHNFKGEVSLLDGGLIYEIFLGFCKKG